MGIILNGIFGSFLNTSKGVQIYDYTGTGTFVDVNYSRGTTTGDSGDIPPKFDSRYMRYSVPVLASDLTGDGITNSNITSIRITSNKNQNIDYNSFKIYIKNGGTNLDITGLSPNLTLTSGTFTGWVARGNYYYIDLDLDTPFVWDGASNMRFYYDFDVPNPSYTGANTSNFVAFVSETPSLINYYYCDSNPLGDNPTPTYSWNGSKQVNYLTFE